MELTATTRGEASEPYQPSYVWPAPAFPFRLYFESSRCRIFIIENVHHNWNWLKEWHAHFRKTDYFLVLCGWYFSPAFAEEADKLFSALSLSKDQFYFLCNSKLEKQNVEARSFQGDVIAQNAWLDENLVMKPQAVEKLYRAIYVGRRSAFKRHMLASKVEGLAIVAGRNHGNALADIPEHVYLNDRQLRPEEVCRKINEARCGLILSEQEGACFASSEYLLCGVPVISTPSLGGRDEWYNDYNSIICDADPDAIANAVDFFNCNPRDPEKIRAMHIDKANFYRSKFITLLEYIFLNAGVTDVDAAEYFRKTFMHKMRRSYAPPFETIFGESFSLIDRLKNFLSARPPTSPSG